MAETYECPFITSAFSRVDKKTQKRGIWCEGGGIRMQATAWKKYSRRYCMHMPGWKDCTIAKTLLEFYDMEEKNEGKT